MRRASSRRSWPCPRPPATCTARTSARRVCAALLPDEATIERVPCSSPGHAEDLVARLHGTGARRVLLVGHIDTVVAHAEHKPLQRVGEQLVGSGTVDMKGGDILAIGALRAFAKRPELYAELALLLVCDEEWRTGRLLATSSASPASTPCLCFEAGELEGRRRGRRRAAQGGGHDPRRRATAAAPTPARRPTAAATRCSRSPPPPRPSPPATTRDGPSHLTAVPTVLRSGDAFNVVPGSGELFCDLRADDAGRDRGRARRTSRPRSAASAWSPS